MSTPTNDGVQKKRISRATFLKGLAGGAVAIASGKLAFDALNANRKISCRVLGPSMELGHRIRDGKSTTLPVGAPVLESKVTIIGGGIAGLSAGWWLRKNGFNDFQILELEKFVGGNSASGSNKVSAYPWGAHYVPLANKESEYVRILFQELGVIQGFDTSGQPIYNDLYMCHDPEERLLKDGSFQEGLIPARGLQESDKEELKRFFETMSHYRELIGKDGRPAFAIPVDLSSQDEELIALDKVSMADWLKQNKYLGRPIRWYVNYCCRDDYGGTSEHVSAWAGIHYFAGRKGTASNAEMNSVVTWPAGNGFLVEKLRERLDAHIKTGHAVTRISQNDGKVFSTLFDSTNKSLVGAKSDFVICATPRFLAKHVIENCPNVGEQTYSPWLVANICLVRVPEGKGVGLAWDNVSYASKSLGYVVATHQNITTRKNAPTVVTYYYPLTERQPTEERRALMTLSPDEWTERIIADLEKMHPGIRQEIESIDLWPWGHGMIRPSVGYVWGDTRKKMKENLGNIFFAHSDMSGISNFEEAQYHGVEAAKQILARVG